MDTRNSNLSGRDGAASPGVIAGVVIAGIGVLLLLQNLDFFHVRDLLRYWPVILIAAGLAKAVDADTGSGRVWGGILMLAGAMLLADRLGYVHLRFRIIWPVALIAVGALMLWGALEGWGSKTAAAAQTSVLSAWAIFGGGKRRVASQDFRGGEVLAIFGGYEIDLRDADIAGREASITTKSVFGGVELRVPPTWRVDLRGAGIFGGYEDKTRPPADPAAKRLVVRGVAVFGGVEVKN